ncbi:MAG TPA: TRAM domain-containing protein [Nitrososphaeraceae archaeon]|nr:TRAM domain-containing protein [Nitrososphaeraceae archaeon]
MSYPNVTLFWTDKCGYANCAICKDAIPNSEYWSHIRSHPGHKNDGPTPPRTAFENSQQNESKRNRYYGGSKSFNRWSTDATQLEVGKEYQVDITQIGDRGDGIARIQGSLIFVKGGSIGGRVKIMITETRSRYAIARTIK